MTRKYQNQAIFALLLCGYAIACCGGPQVSNENKYTIKAGVGIEECPIHCKEGTFSKLFQSTKLGTHLLAHQHGVEAQLVRGKVKHIFFYFNSQNIVPFNGMTESGIGIDSSRGDVIQQYGEPDDIVAGPTSLAHGEMGREEDLIYKKQGISFSFVNNRLATIHVFSLPTNSEISIQEKRAKLIGEWQANLDSYTQKMPFKRAFLTGTVGGVIRFEANGTAKFFVPCDVNESITKELSISGKWSLKDNSEFEARFHENEKNFEIKGELKYDDESSDIDQLIIMQANKVTKKFGRFDRGQLNCN